ncbi:MAG: RNA polymerase sigma-70 factor [Cytophagales bacterium]|nr:RNA polymerase sigma-70 factor [Cytophagales bacterium]
MDRSFILSLKRGDKDAFTTLFHHYADKIYGLSLRMHLRYEDAEEVCQEVFLKLWEMRGSFDESKSLNSYIFTIAKNIVLQKIRKRAYSIALEKYWKTDPPPYTRNTEENVEKKDLEKHLKAFISRLPEKQKNIIGLRMNESLSNDEIAKRLGISKRTVENQIYRALKKMRSFYGNINLENME